MQTVPPSEMADRGRNTAGRLTPSRTRIASVDIIRGAVMVLMALDHVRVYSGLPAGGASPGIFFTRWVTHFCAPAFVFFAGTAAFLYGRKLASQKLPPSGSSSHPRGLPLFRHSETTHLAR